VATVTKDDAGMTANGKKWRDPRPELGTGPADVLEAEPLHFVETVRARRDAAGHHDHDFSRIPLVRAPDWPPRGRVVAAASA